MSANKIIMLGTGHGGVIDLFNTCFVIQNESGSFLIDTGGSIEIIKRLEEKKIDIKSLKHIFISHSHTDHILGLIWIFKKLGRSAANGEIKESINIYCNDVVYEAIIQVCKYILQEGLWQKISKVISFQILKDDSQYNIYGNKYTFFDIIAKGTKQFGFETILNQKKVIFLGDEPLNSKLENRVRNADFVLHETFCLDKEEKIFEAFKKNHSTVKTACEKMNELNVKNLVLFHTEESHGNDRKRLYEEEGNKVFHGNLVVPEDLEEIIL